MLHGQIQALRVRVSEKPRSATPGDIRLLTKHIEAAVPTVGVHEYSITFSGGEVATGTNISMPATLEKIRQRLARDFLIGLTVDLTAFLAVLALELGWPSQALCLPLAHTRRNDDILQRSLAKKPEVVADKIASANAQPRSNSHYTRLHTVEVDRALNEILRLELGVYQAAVNIHHAQTRRHGEAFQRVVEELGSDSFTSDCEARRLRAKKSVNNSRASDLNAYRKDSMLISDTCPHFDVLP